MNFIEAVIAIAKSKNLSLCDDAEERSGFRDICVYKKIGDGVLDDEFIGKLRWNELSEINKTLEREIINDDNEPVWE